MGKFFLFLGIFLFLAQSAEPGQRGLVIVGLGDSTTAGTPGFRSPVEAPPHGLGNPRSQYGFWLKKKHPEWKFFNRGVNGERTDQILARLETDVLSFSPDLVIVLAGVNDLYQGRSLEEIKNNLEQIYARAASAGIGILACTVLPYNLSTPEVRLKMTELNRWIKSFSREQGFAFCDTHAAAADTQNPDWLAGSPDNLHPDVKTYRKMGYALSKAVEQWLEAQAETERARNKR